MLARLEKAPQAFRASSLVIAATLILVALVLLAVLDGGGVERF